ncbi:MAG: hypothetical protein IT190_04290, partial [Microbacteriaceae bacterium]|nr:hypothetical protein [Microbacteriaceae bacterium]
FQIEVGLAYGGDLGPDPKEEDEEQKVEAVVKRGKIVAPDRNVTQARVIRFANRVPLLYQQSACCVFKSVLELDWRRYGLSQSSGALPQAPICVMIHMASVWVPFTSESKDAIADYDEIRAEIKLGLQECGRKLSAYINKRRRMKYEGERRNVFEKYIQEVVEACATIKGKIDKKSLAENLQAIAEKVTARADEELDDHGRVVRKRSEAEEEFGDNVVVIDRNAPPAEDFKLSSGG